MPQESFDPPNPPVSFVGREEEIQWLSQRLSLARSSRYEVDFSIIGEAGIGKTALVAEFAHRTLQGSSTVWIDGGSWNSPESEVDVAIPRVQEEIRLRRDEGRGTTVIIDGLNEVSERLAAELYYGIRDGRIVRRVITTSRERPRLRIPKENQRELNPLSSAEVGHLISSKMSLSGLDEAEIMKLISVIDGSASAALIMAGMAKMLSSERLRRLLSGEIYDLSDAKPDLSATKIGRIVKPLIVADNERILRDLKKQPMDLLKLTPRQFEGVIADLLQHMGYEVELTPETKDGGKDIIAAKNTEIGKILCLVDAKRYKETKKIGVGMVRTLLGTLVTHRATKAMLATTATYSKDARKMEEKHEYELKLADFANVVEWVHKYGE